MTFATPFIAIIAAAIAVPALVILYFLKLRRRDMEVSTTLLWKKAIQDLQANAPFQKLRNNILLILQLLALAAALFALAQPEFKKEGVTNSRHIILIDRSASMSTIDPGTAPTGVLSNVEPAEGEGGAGGPTRLSLAKKKALEIVEALREPGLLDDKGEEAMVIAFDTSANVLQTFTSSKPALRQAIESIEPTDAPSSLDLAFTLAKGYTGVQKFEDQVEENRGFVPSVAGATIHLVSDGRLPDAEKIAKGVTDSLLYHAIGKPETANIGVTGLRAERAFDNPNKVTIFVGLQSTSLQQRTVDVELAIDGVTTRVEGITIGAATYPSASTTTPGAAPATTPPAEGTDNANKTGLRPGVGGFVYPLERAEGGIATVEIRSVEDNALAADDRAYLVIPPAKRLNVALITSGNLFLRTALEGMNLSKLDILKPAEFQRIVDAGQTGEYDVFVFDRNLPQLKADAAAAIPGLTAPAPAAAPGATTPTTPTPTPPPAPSRFAIPPGRSLVLGIVPPLPLGLIDEGEGPETEVIDWSRDHPALQLAELSKMHIIKSRKVRIAPDTPVKEIARTTGGLAIAEINEAAARAIIVPFDPGESDWPFLPGWVLFVANSVLYLADATSGAMGETTHPGGTLSTRLPVGAEDVRISLPDRARIDLQPAPDGTVSYGPVIRNGIYTISWNGPSTPADVVVDGRARRPIAANLLDPSESDVGAATKLAIANDEVAAQEERKSALTQKLWPWLILTALAVVMLEWFVYNRKVAI